MFFLPEPIGGSKPKFSQESESLTFTKSSGGKLALLCPAQGSPIPSYRLECFLSAIVIVAEPIGGAKPKFSQKTETLAFTEMKGTELGLLCPAQASPVPSFR